MTTSADLIIIGGGIAGVSLAARIAGDRRVILLEGEDQFAYHSTGRSAAMFIRNYGPPVIRVLNRLSEPFLRDHEGFSESPLLSPRGEMTLDFGVDAKEFDAYIDGSKGLEILSADEAHAMVPILNRDRLQRAAYEPDASEIDVHMLFSSFQKQAKSKGADLKSKQMVEALSHQDGIWRVTTKDDVFEAPIVVNAAGAWVDHIARHAGIKPIGITPKRRSAVIIPGPEGCMDWPMIVPAAEDWYAKPDAGRLMISPADADPIEAHDAYPDDMVLAEGIDRFSQATTLEVTRVERSWAGLRSFAPDGDPVVGFADDADGFFWLGGQGGYGIQTSPALSSIAASLLMGQSIDADLEASLTPTRFNTKIEMQA